MRGPRYHAGFDRPAWPMSVVQIAPAKPLFNLRTPIRWKGADTTEVIGAEGDKGMAA